MGLSPFEASATFSMMPYTEFAHGVWYPTGGMYRVTEALMEIARQAGVEFAFNTMAKEVELNGRRANGVILEDWGRLEADAVLANADLPYVYQNLLPPDRQLEQLARKRYSCSVISFFNLYFVGASTHPGTFAPTFYGALVGADLCVCPLQLR